MLRTVPECDPTLMLHPVLKGLCSTRRIPESRLVATSLSVKPTRKPLTPMPATNGLVSKPCGWWQAEVAEVDSKARVGEAE
jgi:hypothetical protein